MYTVVKQKVNSSELRSRLGFEPDLIQARIMRGDFIVHIVEGYIAQEKLVDRIVKKELAKLA